MDYWCSMASRGGAALRMNGSRDKICHFKLVLLGEKSGIGIISAIITVNSLPRLHTLFELVDK